MKTGAILKTMDMDLDGRPYYSVKDYLDVEAHSGLKHEYFDGQILAMAGGSIEHSRLAIAIGHHLSTQLADKPCAVYSSDGRIRIGATGLITYPDLSVCCGPIERDGEDNDAQTNPTVLIEVTSPTTAKYDRGKKFEHYRLIPALREYVIVSQHDRLIEVFRRGDDDGWSLAARGGPGERVALTSIGCELDVDAVYRDPRAVSS